MSCKELQNPRKDDPLHYKENPQSGPEFIETPQTEPSNEKQFVGNPWLADLL
jgi:hypothetical protein